MFFLKVGSFLCIIVSILSLLFVENADVVMRSAFGEHCNDTFKCNRNAWLTCQTEGKCHCAFPDEMVFDATEGKCVSKAGERCRHGIDDTIYQKSDCVPDANCGDEGLCTCSPLHYEIPNGTCQQQAALGEDCLTDLTCRRDKHLICVNGSCDCDADSSEASEDGAGHCVGLAEKDCLSERCTVNATCQAISKTCMCLDGQYQDDQGRCHLRKGHMEPCTCTPECQSFLTCWNGSCICDPDTGTFSLFHRPVPTVPTVLVAGNDSCTSITTTTTESGQIYIHSLNYPQNYTNSLKCIWLLTADPDQRITFEFQDVSFEGNDSLCYDYIAIFDGGSTSAPNITQVCGMNMHPPMTSTRNQMSLGMKSDNIVADRGFKGLVSRQLTAPRTGLPECVGLAGNPCSMNQNCVLNAQCTTDTSTCVCKDGYSPTSTGRCGLSFDATCIEDEDICSDAFVCTERKCNCHAPDHQLYKDHKCLSIISGPCSSNTDCIDGAECTRMNKTRKGFCQCKEGFVDNSNGTCELGYGGFCSHGIELCDKYAGLKCRNGICACPDESYHFEEGARRCVGLVGSRCSSFWHGDGKMKHCVENAECVGIFGVCQCNASFEETEERLCTRVA